MTERYDNHEEDIVVDSVDDAVIADAYPKSGSASQRSGCGWSWVMGKKCDCPLNAGSDILVEFAQGSHRRWADSNAVGAHVQPRSTLTCSQGMFSAFSAIASSKASASSASSSDSKSSI